MKILLVILILFCGCFIIQPEEKIYQKPASIIGDTVVVPLQVQETLDTLFSFYDQYMNNGGDGSLNGYIAWMKIHVRHQARLTEIQKREDK